ncbi:urease accessory protein UreD [Paenibacillus sp. NPDC058174]|uniref:urease accessory protein UreD n=1 Tax=Paenibacillus sp. NPDC058174 TaxID=3346366 RepID=UPI0036D8A38D
MTRQEVPSFAGWQMQTSVLHASFARANGGAGTILTDKYHTAPIKIAKAFPLEGQLGVIVMDVSPGLLNGDRYEFDWRAGEGAYTFITNQSYTKVHPSGEDGGSSMLQSFSLERDAVIEHMPEPIMLFQSAALDNKTRVTLAPGAVWMQADVLCPGRTLRNEVFRYRELRNTLTVHYGEELIFAQRQRIKPPEQRLSAPGCWEAQTHWATFYLFSDRVNGALLEALQMVLDQLPSFQQHTVLAGATLTYRHGIAVSAASTAAWPLQQTMRLLWDAARLSMFGKPPLSLLRN